jgi:hypothetical protein
MNAWKHGLTAEKVVIPGEDVEQLKPIRRELWEEDQPSPGMESLLVERLAYYDMRRALVLEAALLEDGPSRPGKLGYGHGQAWRLCCAMRWRSRTRPSHFTAAAFSAGSAAR